MSLFLILVAPILALGAIAMNGAAVLKGRERLHKLGMTLVRRAHSQVETVDLWREPPLVVAPSKGGYRTWIATILSTRMGIWAILASFLFLVLWVAGWVSAEYPLGFLAHLVASWAGGAILAGGVFGVMYSFAFGARFLCTRDFASKTGLRGIWIARGGKAGSRFLGALRDGFASAQRVELLDFTGYELIAKGTTEEGGPVASLLRRFPDKEVRLLLFNPSAREIDPDRKHTTVIQSQLVTMEMSQEAFQAKIVATLNRVKALNRDRAKPIEVRLYSSKPSFRMLVAGETVFLGSIDPRDATGELPMVQVQRLSEEPSLHAAARAHFIQVWGESCPLEINTSAPAERQAAAQNGRPGSMRVAKSAVA
jgi:hypothetical protein